MIKEKILLLFLLLCFILYVNHQRYGNSASTYSQYERIVDYYHELNKDKKSKELADYIYQRILYYQSIQSHE